MTQTDSSITALPAALSGISVVGILASTTLPAVSIVVGVVALVLEALTWRRQAWMWRLIATVAAALSLLLGAIVLLAFFLATYGP